MLAQIVTFWGYCWVRYSDPLHGPADHFPLHRVTIHGSLTGIKQHERLHRLGSVANYVLE
jgi:hypothetical protein